MGILNVTPDSFADGGRWVALDSAVEHGRAMQRQGAAIVDVGAESTRPGATPVDEAEQKRRVVPVVAELARSGAVSIDTRHRGVAEAAIEAGAVLVNDVSATLWPVAASAQVGWVTMHSSCPGGSISEMHALGGQRESGDVVDEIVSFLVERAAQARAAGVPTVLIDPGLGFGKTQNDNVALVARLDELVATGWPVLIGASRKRFVGAMTGGDSGPDDRLEGSLAVATWAFVQRAAMVRVHDVASTVAARRLVLEHVEMVEGQAA